MIETAQRTVEPLVMIEDRASAVHIERCSKLLRNARQIDIFAAKIAVVVMERVHWRTVAAQKLQGRAISKSRLYTASSSGIRQRLVIFAAVLRFNSNVNKFLVPAESLAILIRSPWLMRDGGNDRGKFSDADLPDVQIGHD